MDVIGLRKALHLTQYHDLTVAHPDRTGWADVSVTDTISGAFGTVGQWKNGEFRAALRIDEGLRLSVPNLPITQSTYVEPPGDITDWTLFILMFWDTFGALFVLFAWIAGNYQRSIDGALIVIAVTALIIRAHIWCTNDDKESDARRKIASTAPIETFEPRPGPSISVRTLSTIGCPDCGSPVSGTECEYCGWTRADA